MSLVSTYVVMDDGLFYKNPVIFDDTNNWYICFDDEDPPEFVIRKNVINLSSKKGAIEKINRFLEEKEIPAKAISISVIAQRDFSIRSKKSNFIDSIGVYLSFSKRIPISNFKHLEDGVDFDSGNSQCVVYDPEYNRNNHDIWQNL